MAMSELQRAKRALVAVMLSLGRAYGFILGVNRESADKDLTSAYRRLAKKVHPDKGDKAAEAKKLNPARDVWEEAKKKSQGSGGHNQAPCAEDPENSQSDQLMSHKQKLGYRIASVGVLMTYQPCSTCWGSA